MDKDAPSRFSWDVQPFFLAYNSKGGNLQFVVLKHVGAYYLSTDAVYKKRGCGASAPDVQNMDEDVGTVG